MLTEVRRPRRLNEIQGQSNAVTLLTAWVKEYGEKGTADAFLFHSKCGGTGKTSLAHVLANELDVDFAFEQIDSSRCNVETVRAMRDDLMLAPFSGRWKIVLVDEADTMSLAAKDAWLSLLERIPKYRLIIFTTNNITAFDLVFQSRVKVIELQAHSPDALVDIMCKAIPDGRAVPKVVMWDIASKAQGNARAALQELEKHLLITPPADDEVLETVAARIEENHDRANVQPVVAGSAAIAVAVQAEAAPPAPKAQREEDMSKMTFTLRPSSTGNAPFVEILFPSKPDLPIRDELVAARFRWTPFRDGARGTGGVWYGRKIDLPARYKQEEPCQNLSSSASSAPASVTTPTAPEALPSVPAPKDQPDPTIVSVAPTSSCVPVVAAASLPTPKAAEVSKLQMAVDAFEKSHSIAIAIAKPQHGPDNEGPRCEDVCEELLMDEPEPPKPEVPAAPPALKVRRTLGGKGFSVIHVKSNKALGKAFTDLVDEAAATRLMNAVIALADWTQPMAEVVKVAGLRDKLMQAATEHLDAHVEVQPDARLIADFALRAAANPVEPSKPATSMKDVAIDQANAEPPAPVEPSAEERKPEPAASAPAKIDYAAKLRSLIGRKP